MYNETIRDLLGVRDPREGLPKLDIKAVAADVRLVGICGIC